MQESHHIWLDRGDSIKLKGRKALITGDNSGIGLATARLFVAESAEVAITGRDQKTLDESVTESDRKRTHRQSLWLDCPLGSMISVLSWRVQTIGSTPPRKSRSRSLIGFHIRIEKGNTHEERL